MNPSETHAEPLLRAIPRREPLVARATEQPPPMRRRAPIVVKASIFRTLGRGFRWLIAGLMLALRLTGDHLRGRRSARQRGRRFRQMFQEMGGTAIKVGQQLSVRIDMLPFEMCDELSHLVDKVPAFPAQYAIERLERTVGARRGVERVPIAELFSAFDPVPIGSASVACVWQGLLLDGTRVAVKVRRPGIGATFGEDLAFIDFGTKLAELLTLVKSGFFKNLRSELRSMLLEELDFALEARYQRLFRRWAKRDRLKYVKAPRVYTELSGPDVLVTRYVDGILCTEILAAHEKGDPEVLGKLREMGITPKKVGKRLMQYSFWSRYEALFFHADPHHGNIFVERGCKLVFIDFGSCGTLSRKSRLAQFLIMDRMRANDVPGTASAALATIEPLPFVDVYALQKEIEAAFWDWLFAFRDKKAEWWERTTTGLWAALLEITRRHHIPVGLETLRLFRSLLLIDTLCFRLDPKMVSPDDFVKYERAYMRRGARKAIRRIEDMPLSQHKNTLIKEMDDFRDRALYLKWEGERLLEGLPKDFASTVSKGYHILIESLRVCSVGVLAIGAVYLYVHFKHEGASLAETHRLVKEAVLGKYGIPLLILGLGYLYRRIKFRLCEVDIERVSLL